MWKNGNFFEIKCREKCFFSKIEMCIIWPIQSHRVNILTNQRY